ncbi:aminomethyl-transferring glycine dehydrogenase [Oceanitalea stevensii]|uniref:Glycine dehydrogenase (decarboxylating) n=1 Tax=Oceanitalea stevensii TaxID=2763072 RepID=A0ABR8Z217_9MICO|nr:aminomethyl-transferring glycine dehydrogenase [Oceanitalea stevensii]MBD8062207.1 aminomethyl-transferring glycine dehydrogenase [Oceanitalea stevensii]
MSSPSFADRHVGPRAADTAAMLDSLGHADWRPLLDSVPPAIRQQHALDLPAARTEAQVLDRLRELAGRNVQRVQMIGQGYYATHTPSVIQRCVLESPAWYTAYTPYQPEISQGRLEGLLNFQTAVADLTGLPVANASLLDEATAVAEAVLLMQRANKASTAATVVLDAELHPQTVAVVRARAEAVGIAAVVADLDAGLPDLPDGVTGLVLQQPGTSGRLRDHAGLVAAAKERGAMVTVAADLLALTLITPPGEQGADVAVGSAQRFGVPLFYGGPHAAFMAVREGLERQLPGRLVGVSKDSEGRPALRLALQPREQHIRREKATSNICTAQALLAVVAGMYAVYHGPEGLREIARHAHGAARTLALRLTAGGVEVVHDAFFDTVTVRVPGRAAVVVAEAERAGVNLRLVDEDTVGISCDETTTPEHLAAVLAAFGTDGAAPGSGGFEIPAPLRRTSAFLTHPTFHAHRSETQMMRYLRRLADRDLALDRTMIPLGSCTMKLNAATEMRAMLWPGFASVHPLAPDHQTEGWRELVTELEGWLAEITGYDRVSVQPNAGSQGELAGLLAIRGYHRSRGEDERTVCLIPSSAHGTNAASAVLAGMRVVTVRTAEDGSIDTADLHARIAQHGEQLAAIMLTYPSTHGVFDTEVREVCEAVHAAGGQVYVDGANLNALIGLAQPGEFGGDVSHLNLHKTFCIPHGGGGPGVGPVAVREHLAPFLPGDAAGDDDGAVPVSATRYGSAGVLPISWAYIALMGAEGLAAATRSALLAANYVAKALDPYFPVLYTGADGLVAHECILDLRELTKRSGVTAEDVAKRLVDFGFHAPTLSFPVAGTLMVEPTESEDLAELDRFVEAMVTIHGEIQQILDGEVDVADSPVRRAPHPAADVATDAWDRAYPREQAVFPVPGLRQDKYFPPVSRIDNAYGDRNLVCACPPPEAFEEDR